MPHAATKLFEQPPIAALQPFIRRFLVVEFPAGLADAHLPGTAPVVVFPFRGECLLDDGRRTPAAGATGLWDRVRHHRHSPGNALVIATFKPTGAAAFLRAPLEEIANTTAPLAELLARTTTPVAHLTEQLAAAPNHRRRVELLERFLLACADPVRRDPLVDAAVAWLEQAPPGARMTKLSHHIGLSQSALERRFRRVVGVTPKRFAALVRLQRVLRLQRAGLTFADLAHTAGYCDQPHFIHDFRRLTGRAPQAFFKPPRPAAS